MGSEMCIRDRSEMAKGTSLGMASEEKTSEMRDTGAGTEGAATMDLSGFSDTNVRTEGVGEADIVKTDGKYLYSLKENGNEIAIVDIKDDQMKEISVIQINVPADQTARISEFYIDDGKIFILTNYYAPMVNTGTASFYDDQCTRLDTYDISDITEPKLLGSVTQSGYYHTSRFVDGYLYIFSDFYVYDQCNKEDSDYYIPRINGKTLDASCIYLPPIHSANQYLVVTSVKASEPDTLADQKAVLSEGGQCLSLIHI